jgi:hypothetical protein
MPETKLEFILTSLHKAAMISAMAAHPELFDEAVELALSDTKRFSQRAAWLLWSCFEKNDKRIKPHIKRILSSLRNKSGNHQRELINILLKMELDEEDESRLFDICISLWENVHNKTSIRYTAFKFISATARKYPDLSQEINLLTQPNFLEFLSPSATKAVLKMAGKHRSEKEIRDKR